MNIQYSDGTTRIGIILILTGAEMRVAVQDQEDSSVFKLASGVWLSEDGQEVTFEFELELDDAQSMMPHLRELQVLPRPSACAAGGDCVFRSFIGKPAN